MTSLAQLDASDMKEFPRLSRYSKLDANKREIRLIHLGDNIELQDYSLDAFPPYHALSYHWGSATRTCHVLVQWEVIEIRETVREMFEVLKELYGCEELFWIDSLCINQHDLEERNSQVSIMSDIYSCASDVISWLGSPTLGSQIAFRIIEKELYCPKSAPDRLVGDGNLSYDFVATDEDWPSTEQLEADHNLYKHFAETVVWPALSDLIRRPYWGRMWVVQEIIVAAKSVLLCGKDITSLEKLVKIATDWVTKSQYYLRHETPFRLEAVNHAEHQDVINTWRPLEKLLDYREELEDSRILLMELVDSFAIKKCSNVRDKVYALRALSTEAASIEVNYSKTIVEVFLSLVQSGLLISDGGRGFQSLPHFVRCMGLEHDRLTERLSEVPSALIPIKGRLSGSVLEVALYAEAEADPKDSGSCQLRSTLIKIGSKDKQQGFEHHRSRDIHKASLFLRQAQSSDVLCMIPTDDPILLLLRPIHRDGAERVYQAIANLHDWGRNSGACNREIPEDICAAGEIIVAEDGISKFSQNQRFRVDSRSLAALALWKETCEKWYIL